MSLTVLTQICSIDIDSCETFSSVQIFINGICLQGFSIDYYTVRGTVINYAIMKKSVRDMKYVHVGNG